MHTYTTFIAHSRCISCLAYFPIGNAIVTGGVDRTVCTWRVVSQGNRFVLINAIFHTISKVSYNYGLCTDSAKCRDVQELLNLAENVSSMKVTHVIFQYICTKYIILSTIL